MSSRNRPGARARRRTSTRSSIAPAIALRVSTADKLHNVHALIRDYRSVGEKSGPASIPRPGKSGTLWYYRSLADVFKSRMPGPLTDDLDRAVGALEELTT